MPRATRTVEVSMLTAAVRLEAGKNEMWGRRRQSYTDIKPHFKRPIVRILNYSSEAGTSWHVML